MEAPHQRIARLVGALSQLVNESSQLFDREDLPAGAAVQERCLPLVAAIASMMRDPFTAKTVSGETRQKAESLIQQIALQQETLTSKRAVLSEQLREIQSVQSRTGRFRAAYTQGSGPSRSATVLRG